MSGVKGLRRSDNTVCSGDRTLCTERTGLWSCGIFAYHAQLRIAIAFVAGCMRVVTNSSTVPVDQDITAILVRINVLISLVITFTPNGTRFRFVRSRDS